MKGSYKFLLAILLILSLGVVTTGVVLLHSQSTSSEYPQDSPIQTQITPAQTSTITPKTTPAPTTTSDCKCYSYTLKRYIPCEQATAICRDGT